MTTPTTYRIEVRRRVFVWDDPLHRCYNGAYGAHHYEWSAWELLESRVPKDRVEHKLTFWRELNDDAVSCRGESAKKEYRAEVETTD